MALTLALLLDAALGEPKALWTRVPHPAVLMGRAVGALDAAWNNRTRSAGLAALAVLLAGAIALGLALAALPGQIMDVILAAILLAQRSLADHVSAVAHALRQGLPQGRAAVAMIVGRDTAEMDEPAVARAAIESAAENLSDGVIAPAFWFAVAGLPGILAYKVVNTADSMIGYRTPRHQAFGWASARLDDVLNWVPARLTALLIWAISRRPMTFGAIRHDAGLHRSPNAGWPEAALSRALGVAVAGPRSYSGRLRPFPFVNPAGRHHPGPSDIDAAVRCLWLAWGVAVVLSLVLILF